MLLPVALALTLFVLPLVRATQINWPRWRRALVFVLAGLLLLVGPYIAIKGGLGTMPGIARVLGLLERSRPLALEREAPLPADQTTFESYQLAIVRMLEAYGGAVTFPLLPFAVIGIGLAMRSRARVRAWTFLGIIFAASSVALVRLHATGGYLSVRHALVPGIILSLAAASGLFWLMSKVSIPGRWLGLAHEHLRPGPAVWAALLALLLVNPYLGSLGPFLPGPFSVYHTAGDWLAQNTHPDEEVLDLTDWSLYFSRRAGYGFADFYKAPADPKTRWIVVREPKVEGSWHYSELLRELIGGRDAVAVIPPRAGPNQMQIRIYERRGPTSLAATRPKTDGGEGLRR
jgi:hypothetical protein